MGRVFLDAEFNSSNEEYLNVLCFSVLVDHDGTTTTHDLWMSEDGIGEMKALVESFISEGHTFFAFAVTAEARALHSIGIDPTRIKWIDLQLEYRLLSSNNNKVRVGKHLIDGKVVTLKPPLNSWDKPEGYTTGGKVQHSLASCLYRFLGIQIDTDHKDEMRDLILDNTEWTEDEQDKIMKYCASDVVYLPRLATVMIKTLWSLYKGQDKKLIVPEMQLRGQYAALSALMESRGYPVAFEEMKNFAASVGEIKTSMQRDINRCFPEVEAFEESKSGTRFIQKKDKLINWVKAQGHSYWLKTAKGSPALSLDAFEAKYDHRGDLSNFGNKFLKYMREKQALNGFTDNSKKKTIWDSTGSDGRVRPYMGIYGAQTSRSQPKATAYIPLKSSWMRYLIQPKRGRVIIAIDYSQQEFLLAGLVSQDKNMVEAYHSGDPYLYFAKQAGAIPWEGTKAEYPEIRDKFKSTVLGIQFGMGAKGLASKITKDTGVHCSQDEAQFLIDMFFETYSSFDLWRDNTIDEYTTRGYLKLPDGWTIWGDNDNHRSVLNFPIQGRGAVIMRRGVWNCHEMGLDVIMTLHDAIYVECDFNKTVTSINLLAQCMGEAVKHYFTGTAMEQYAECRMDPQAWGYGFKEGQEMETDIGPMPVQPRYISSRTAKDIEKFSAYFVPDDLAEYI